MFHNWNHGPVIRSWLVELMETALRSRHDMGGVDPYVEDTGEQRWGIEFVMDKEIPVPLLAQAVWGFYEPATRTGRGPGRWLLRHEYGKHPLQGRAGSGS